MVLTIDLSNQAILEVTKGIYKDALAMKTEEHTEEQETYMCQWCDENNIPCGHVFMRMADFVNHIHNTHMINDSAEYTCMWKDCSRKLAKKVAFKAKYKLVNHIRVHSGEKPFKCDQCGKTFARTENLKIHKRTHTGDKPFKCFEAGCDRQFSNSSDRKKHMNVHKKGILICPLPGCDRSYSHPSSMRKHMKTHGAAAKGIPLPERMPEEGYFGYNQQMMQSVPGAYPMMPFDSSPPEPYRRRKKYNLSGQSNNAQQSPTASPEHYLPVASSSPQSTFDPVLANRSGSDSGHETLDQPSPEHTMNDPFFVANYYASIMNPMEQYVFNPEQHQQHQQHQQPAGAVEGVVDWNQYNQFASQFAFNPAVNAYWTPDQQLQLQSQQPPQPEPIAFNQQQA